MKKTFVLDTNVLLHDPSAMLKFEDNDIILPIAIIEELDRFKKQPELTGRNARQSSRILDGLSQQGQLTAGIPINGGGSIKVALCHGETLEKLPLELEGDKGDNAILAVALEAKSHCNCPVVLVSKDTNLRIKANALGLAAADYEADKVDLDELYTGMVEVMVETDKIEEFFQQGKITLDRELFPNQALTLIDIANPSHTALGIVDETSSKIVSPIPIPQGGISRINPRNREQKFAFEFLI